MDGTSTETNAKRYRRAALQFWSLHSGPVLWFWLLLIVAKLVYSVADQWSLYQSWEQHGLFGYNSRFSFITVSVQRVVMGPAPYVAFGLWTIHRSRSRVLAIVIACAVAGSDLFSDLYYRDSTDAQTGIAIMFTYVVLLACVAVAFLGLNHLAKADPSRRSAGPHPPI